MTSRGLKASPEGIRAAKTALTDKTLSQQKLANNLGITRQPVSKFFAGEPVSRSCFVQICQQLGLSWQQVAGVNHDWISEATVKIQPKNFDLSTLIEELRQKCEDKIKDQCQTIQMLDVAWAVPLDAIYTPVNVVEEISSQQWREIADLLPKSAVEANFYQIFATNHQQTLPGIEAAQRYSKLMVLGKLGSGKTTFLQHLAIACNQGTLYPQYVPVFVRLKEFAEDANYDDDLNLRQYISQQFISCGISEEATLSALTQGRVLILLDGLDEVPLEYTDAVTREIRKLHQIYYKNQFVISCRTAAYKYRFPGFTEVELADFYDQQIEVFVKNWFTAIAHQSSSKAETTSNLFIQQIKLPENQPIRELASTPLLLHLICLLFHVKGHLPHNLANLYEQVLQVLLVRWDEIRGIKRYDCYTNFSLKLKKKLIAHIAYKIFSSGEYLFEKDKIQALIAEYLPTVTKWHQKEQLSIDIDETLILEGLIFQDGLLVERARGIYSFAYLALLEYLTARDLIENYQDIAGQSLINHIGEEHWHHVFLLTVNMMLNVDQTLKLMKSQIDTIVASDEKIQQFLKWLNQKTNTILTKNKAVAVRAFYFIGGHTGDEAFNGSLEWDFVRDLDFQADLALDELLFSILNCVQQIKSVEPIHFKNTHIFNHARALEMNFDAAIDLVGDVKLQQALQQLKKQLPCTESNPEKFYVWWQETGNQWEQTLRENLWQYRQIGYVWQWNKSQKALLHQYLCANKFLIACLQRSVNINHDLKQQIETELFLPCQIIEN